VGYENGDLIIYRDHSDPWTAFHAATVAPGLFSAVLERSLMTHGNTPGMGRRVEEHLM